MVTLVALAGLFIALGAGDGEETDEAAVTSPSTTNSTTTTEQGTTTTVEDEPLSAGGLTEGTPEGLPSIFETFGFPLPVPSAVREIRGITLLLQFPPTTVADDFDLEAFVRTVPPQRGWTLDSEDPPPGSTIGPTLYFSNSAGQRVTVNWFNEPGPEGTRIEDMEIRVGA